MAKKTLKEAQNPLILRSIRLMDAFTKADDERDFYLDKCEGFIIFVDLSKSDKELSELDAEIKKNENRFIMIPKLSFFESKKIMEGFVNEKVYDIDTKEKLIDIIQSKDARENFLEFLYDQHAELDKWQQYYQERSRIRIIEWLRNHKIQFVFEEDLDLSRQLIDKLKKDLFATKVGKEVAAGRKTLQTKAKSYYSNEALNPRPKRGRPPKQVVKQEVETQFSADIYSTVPQAVKLFLYTPDISSASAISFSEKFESEQEMLAHRKSQAASETDIHLEALNKKLASLRELSSNWIDSQNVLPIVPSAALQDSAPLKEEVAVKKPAPKKKPAAKKKEPAKKATSQKKSPPKKRIIPQTKPAAKKTTKTRLKPLAKLKRTKKITPKKK